MIFDYNLLSVREFVILTYKSYRFYRNCRWAGMKVFNDSDNDIRMPVFSLVYFFPIGSCISKDLTAVSLITILSTSSFFSISPFSSFNDRIALFLHFLPDIPNLSDLCYFAFHPSLLSAMKFLLPEAISHNFLSVPPWYMASVLLYPLWH